MIRYLMFVLFLSGVSSYRKSDERIDPRKDKITSLLKFPEAWSSAKWLRHIGDDHIVTEKMHTPDTEEFIMFTSMGSQLWHMSKSRVRIIYDYSNPSGLWGPYMGIRIDHGPCYVLPVDAPFEDLVSATEDRQTRERRNAITDAESNTEYFKALTHRMHKTDNDELFAENKFLAVHCGAYGVRMLHRMTYDDFKEDNDYSENHVFYTMAGRAELKLPPRSTPVSEE